MKSFFKKLNTKSISLMSLAISFYWIYDKKRMYSITEQMYESAIKSNRSELLYEEFQDFLSNNNNDIINKLYSKYSKSSDNVLVQSGNVFDKLKDDFEEVVELGGISDFPVKSFFIVDIYKMRNSKNDGNKSENNNENNVNLEKLNDENSNQNNIDSKIFNPEKHFSKVLLFRHQGKFYATGSFCGHCLMNLSEGVYLGNKITCSNCLSEYNIMSGSSERGLNDKYISTFPVFFRNNKICMSIPKTKLVPQFSKPLHVEWNHLGDARIFVIIGNSETSKGALDVLTKCYSGKILVIGNRDKNFFLNLDKLHSNLFPKSPKYNMLVSKEDLENKKIGYINDKVIGINLNDRFVYLENGMKIPYDKVLIANGLERPKLIKNYKNAVTLNTYEDSKKLYDLIASEKTKSLALVGQNLNSLKIISSIRKLADSLGKDDLQLAYIPSNKMKLEKFVSKEGIEILEDYLERNRINIFKNVNANFLENSSGNRISKILLSNNYLNKIFNIPIDSVVIEQGSSITKADFFFNIYAKTKSGNAKKVTYNNDGKFVPDSRFSILPSTNYPHVLASGSCTNMTNFNLSGMINTEDTKTNYDMGLLAGLSMVDFFYPYDYMPTELVKVLDKKLVFIGNPNITYDYNITYADKENGRFISYLIIQNKLSAAVTFGFNKLDIYMKEAFENKILPNPINIKNNIKTCHNMIMENVIKSSDGIKCLMDDALKRTNKVDLSTYDQIDQSYLLDLTTRMNAAIKNFEDLVKEVDERKINDIVNKYNSSKKI